MMQAVAARRNVMRTPEPNHAPTSLASAPTVGTLRHEKPIRHYRHAGLDANAGLGSFLLSARRPRGTDRTGHQPVHSLDLRGAFIRPCGLRRSRARARALHRPSRRARHSMPIEHRIRRRIVSARRGHRTGHAAAGVARVGDRHGRRPLRIRLRCADAALWTWGAQCHHGNHSDRRVCQHHRLAGIGIARTFLRMARRLPRVGSVAPVLGPAAQCLGTAP